MSEPVTKKGLNTTQIILIVGIVAIIAVIAVVGFLFLNRKQEPTIPQTAAPAAGNVVLDEDNFQNVIDELNRKAAEGMFEVKMNAVWNFPNGASPSTDAYVANSTANSKPIYFDVTLPDTGEVIYTSPEIPVGSAVKDIALTKALTAGNYECTLNYYLLNEDKTVASSVGVVVRLNIKA